MKNDNFYKTLRIVCLILAIVCMALSLFKKAKAAEHETIDDYFWTNYFLNDLSTYNIDLSSYNSYLGIIKSESTAAFRYEDSTTIQYRFLRLPDYAGYYLQGLNWSGGAFRINDPTGSSYNPCLISGHNLSFYSNLPNSYTFGVSINIGKNGQVQFRFAYTSRSTIDSQMSRTGHIIPSFDSISLNTNIIASVSETANNNTIISGSTNTQHPEIYYSDYDNWLSSGLIVYGDLLVMSRYNDGYPAIINENYIAPPSVNTEGFDVYKYGSENNERIVCDFTNCINISPAVGNTSSISLTFEIDSVEETFNFDSTSNFYYYNYGSNIAARYSFPLYIFGIDNETINARLTNVTVTNITSSPGGTETRTINWVIPIVIVGSNYDDETASNISKDTLPDYNTFDDPATQQSYKETTNRWLTSTYNTLPLSLFNRWNFEVRYKVIPIYEEGLGSSALNAFLTAITQALNLQFGDVVQTAIELYNGHSIYEIIEDVLQNNQYSEYYDLIAFCYQDANGSDPVYYIYTTDTYNNHLTNSYLYDIMQTIYDDGKALDSIYNYLYDRLDDFETKSLNKMNEAVGLDEIENDLLEKIRKLLDQILNAILNINIDIPEADYTDILSKLDTIIDNQDTSDINDDWYQNYREWLYGINENDSYLSPHEYFNNIFGTLKTTFDSFTDNISFNAYLLKVEDMINHISGSTTDNLTIYLRDGIGDPSFNINNNYMYTVGGTP